MNLTSWLHLDVNNIHGFALFNHLFVHLMCNNLVSSSKYVLSTNV
jgi:hypothetical protein